MNDDFEIAANPTAPNIANAAQTAKWGTVLLVVFFGFVIWKRFKK